MWKKQLKAPIGREEYISGLLEKLKGKEVYLFGAGVGGSRTSRILNERRIENITFVDNNKQKQGTLFCDREVIAPATLAERYREGGQMHIVITAGEGTVMMRQLLALGISQEDVSIFDTSQIMHTEDNQKFLLEYEKKITKVFSLLQDEYSKKVLMSLLNYRLTLDFAELQDIYEEDEEQYFAPDLVDFSGKMENCVFVDAGTYDGLTVKEYMQRCGGKYGKVICFEADENNVNTIKQNFAEWNIERADIYALGLWSEKTVLKFDAIGSGSGRISDEGTVSLNVDALDHVLKHENIDFVKMDIEGAEVEALKGAKELISMQKPILAISVYHNPGDIFEIPLLIHEICPEYKLYLRHYRQFSAQETICYAIKE